MSWLVSGSAARRALTFPSIASRSTIARVARIPLMSEIAAEITTGSGSFLAGTAARSSRLESGDQFNQAAPRGETDDLPRVIDDRDRIDPLLKHERGELRHGSDIPNADYRRSHQLLRRRRHDPA